MATFSKSHPQSQSQVDLSPFYSFSDSKGDRHTLARGLGWMSIGLGLFELWQKRSLSRNLGTPGDDRLYLAYGLREIGTGIGLLCARNPTPWVWGRVAGDLLDLATLAPELRPDSPHRKTAGGAAAIVAGATLLDVYCATRGTWEDEKR